ncbi:unnamed protein product [Rotaria sordida]|uniref:RING-type domain-containing protein n=1 Tax=Rotaria sordida TaxID=392033 RepID=A0A815GB81_9BILA|nr:unnamed protein product [Rotaria sordida]CAF4029171.1 unnamed protein product [Rotaria sordida]
MASNHSPSNSTENLSESSSSSKINDDFLNELLMCGICLSRMSSPCCLPCAHSFCRSCLLDYVQNNNNNNINTTTSIHFILCPYCKYQFNFHSYEHFESILIINPILKQLCEALDTSKFNSNQQQQQQQTQSNGIYRARCHTCCLLKMLKICKHCHFMLCEICRRTHLLDVHRESKLQLDLLETRINLINKKRLEMNKKSQEYNYIRQRIENYVQDFINEIEKQRDQALQIINEQQHSNDEHFWKGNGFENAEKLDFFNSLVQMGQKKLLAKHITDKDLIELSDNLQTIPDINEKLIEFIQFTQLTLEVDETFSTKQFIRVYDYQENKKSTNQNEQTDCISS